MFGVQDPKVLVATLALTVVVILVTGFLIYRDHIAAKNDPEVRDDIFTDAMMKELASDDMDPNSFKDFKNPYVSRKNDKYSFTQTDEEMEIYIPLVMSTENKVPSKQDVKVALKSASLRVSILGEKYIEGVLTNEIDMEGSSWQILEDKGQKAIWLSLLKKERTEAKNYWPSLFRDEKF